ncbi:EhaE family protein [Methanoculleus sp.]|uniref:EhaE family protein n=1 Tax=Methanoculleus sp. TaxID=90427 RepID=UPI0025D3CB3F|nr:EhaE family protein [Methanoculleus sp.]
MTPEFILGCIILIAGVIAAGFPREKTYLSRLINLEIPAFGLLLIMLAYDETLALMTFIGVTAISTFVLVRVIERRDAG